MCKAPKPPAPPKPKRPQYMVNPVLDSAEGSAVGQLRIGRSALRSDIDRLTVRPTATSPTSTVSSSAAAETGLLMADAIRGRTIR